MPLTNITAIISQPALSGVFSAYNPIPYIVRATNSPVVYCDIYFNGTYYKTLTATTELVLGGLVFATWYWFDISDACQEFLRSNIPIPPAINTVTVDPNSAASVFVKFRASSLVGGVVVPEGPVPIQATLDTAAVPGGGTQSDTICVLNAAQQFTEPGSFRDHLLSLRRPAGDPAWLIYPLTHRKTYQVHQNGFDFMPVFVDLNGLLLPGFTSAPMTLSIVDNFGNEYFVSNTVIFTGKLHYIPFGPLNIRQMTGGAGPGVPFHLMSWYKVRLRYSGMDLTFESLQINVEPPCGDDRTVWFLNALGGYESALFGEPQQTIDIKSQGYQKLNLNPVPYAVGKTRTNIKATETNIVHSYKYTEADQDWLKELFGTVQAYTLRPSSTYAGPLHIAITIVDATFTSLKAEERYNYITEISYTPSYSRTYIR